MGASRRSSLHDCFAPIPAAHLSGSEWQLSTHCGRRRLRAPWICDGAIRHWRGPADRESTELVSTRAKKLLSGLTLGEIPIAGSKRRSIAIQLQGRLFRVGRIPANKAFVIIRGNLRLLYVCPPVQELSLCGMQGLWGVAIETRYRPSVRAGAHQESPLLVYAGNTP